LTQIQDITSPMTRVERRATLALASIYALRMLGLFMILPVLSLFAEGLTGSTPFLTGLALSIYGLTQAILQIPFGLWSDRYGRKRVIIAGLLLFALGSVVAALSTTIYGVLAGRALQGAGAVAAAVMALVADLTQEVHRTKAMAVIGASIALAFAVAVTIGPVIAGWAGISGLFWSTALLAVAGIAVVRYVVPDPPHSRLHRDAEVVPAQFHEVLTHADLLRLNFGIFSLHAILTALFVVTPLLLRDAGIASAYHGWVYLPLLLSSLALAVPLVIIGEKKRRLKPVFLGTIALLTAAQLALYALHGDLYGLLMGLWLFFAAFNLLEATLPSLISKTAPAGYRGTAMGVYSTSQFVGAFVGGALGGWLLGHADTGAVFVANAMIALLWWWVALMMTPPRYVTNLLIPMDGIPASRHGEFADALIGLDGVSEVCLQSDERVVYLKIDTQRIDLPTLQRFVAAWSQA